MPNHSELHFRQYQLAALETDIAPKDGEASLAVPLFGLAGEVGELLSAYKKHFWAGEAHKLSKERVAEELGDLLWYLANLASKFDLDLNDVATANLRKCRDRWSRASGHGQLGLPLSPGQFDSRFPENERLPRQMLAEIREFEENGLKKIELVINGQKAGDNLTDNAYRPDGYRFHDVFHLAYAAVLNWSPITRGNLKRKRKSDRQVDEVEDGGRAAVVEEGIAAMVFAYASRHEFLKGIQSLDSELLRIIRGMTSGLEVSRCSTAEWEKAILAGFDVWRKVKETGRARLCVDLDAQTIQLQEVTSRCYPPCVRESVCGNDSSSPNRSSNMTARF
jgi:NTP pyrophosphatase (non-canonical NTP hydrolase)